LRRIVSCAELHRDVTTKALGLPCARDTMAEMNGKFFVGLIQMRCTKDAGENLARACEKIREAARRGAQIICTHELFRSEYFCRI